MALGLWGAKQPTGLFSGLGSVVLFTSERSLPPRRCPEATSLFPLQITSLLLAFLLLRFGGFLPSCFLAPSDHFRARSWSPPLDYTRGLLFSRSLNMTFSFSPPSSVVGIPINSANCERPSWMPSYLSSFFFFVGSREQPPEMIVDFHFPGEIGGESKKQKHSKKRTRRIRCTIRSASRKQSATQRNNQF